jgi:hypothetical protein
LRAFEVAIHSKYVDELVAHSHGFATQLCKVAGDEAVRKVVKDGLERAQKAGWDQQHLVRFYIELAFTLGSSFDRDPQYPWIQQYLAPSEIENTQTRACHLFTELSDYQSAVLGPSNSLALAALRRFAEWDGEELRSPVVDVHQGMFALAQRLYPEKAAYLGLSLTASITEIAARDAAVFGLSSNTAVLALGGLMMAFGSGVCTDPLYPWVSRVLNDTLITTPTARLQRLFQKTKHYASAAVEYLVTFT